jgi:hypothetical protein
MRRAPAILVASALVILAAGWTTRRTDVQPPPSCSPEQTQRQAILMTGAYSTGGSGYARHCGPGVVTITPTAGGRSMTIRGGTCGRIRGYGRWITFGLFSNGSLSRQLGRGVGLVIEPGNRAGRVKVIDGLLQPLTSEVGLTGSATLAADLKSGSFTVTTRGGLGPGRGKKFTGTWTCWPPQPPAAR